MDTVNPTAETQASPEAESLDSRENSRTEQAASGAVSREQYEQVMKEKAELQDLLQRRQAATLPRKM